MLGIQTQGRRMVGADETTELWRPKVVYLPSDPKHGLPAVPAHVEGAVEADVDQRLKFKGCSSKC